MSKLTRQEYLDRASLKYEVVPLPELGGEMIVRGLSGTDRDSWESSLVEGRGRKARPSMANVRAKLVALSCVDEDGNRIFTDQDVEEIGRRRADVLDKLFTVAQRLSGLSKEEVDDLGNSTTAAPSISASPSN